MVILPFAKVKKMNFEKYDRVIIKEWFIPKIREKFQGLSIGDCHIMEMTEKACLVEVECTFWNEVTKLIDMWIPKSALLSYEDWKLEEEKASKAFEKGKKEWEKLHEFCLNLQKEGKLKGRVKGLSKNSLLKKLAEAGISYEEKEEIPEEIKKEEKVKGEENMKVKKEEIKKIIESYKKELSYYKECNDLGYEQYDYPILYIGNDGYDYEIYTNYSRAIPSYIEMCKEYEGIYIPTIEEVCNDIEILKAI